MTLTILRAADRPAQPWKNGGGQTREVIASPSSGTAGDFDWRVSMAEVGVAGPFSSFPGIDRTLRVVEGRLELIFADPASVRILTPDTAALDFPGDVAVTGRPLDGPVLDLNLMVRRGRFRGSIRHLTAGPIPAGDDAMTTRLLIALAPTAVRIGEARHALERYDAVLMEPLPDAEPVCVDQPVLLLRIQRL